VFPSLAQAQASVANEVYQELGQPSVFLFCPTEYCSSLCSPSPSQSCYLQTIGQELLPGIAVIWTGEAGPALGVWPSKQAEPFFLGPYMGRAPGLMARLQGLLLNPNCELQANFIPIHTLGTWFGSELGSCAHPEPAGTWHPCLRQPCLPSPAGLPRLMSCGSSGTEGAPGDSQGARDGGYSPQEALELALRDWVAEINQQALEPGK
ncbi:OGA GlcNAcase, partial [Calcarius ornatus]|nr:OGA GlcNAcase [Calcarius ornatus]